METSSAQGTKKAKKKILLAAFVYIVLLWISSGGVSSFLIFFIIGMSLWLTMDEPKMSLFFLLCTVLLSPLMALFFQQALQFRSLDIFMTNLMVAPLLIPVFMALLFRYWSFIQKPLARTLFWAFTVMTALSFWYLTAVPFCTNISNAEKGVSIEEIKYCQMLNLYNSGMKGSAVIGVLSIFFLPGFILYLTVALLYISQKISLLLWRQKKLSENSR